MRVVVLKGAGEKAFISGADINRFEERLGSAQVGKSDGDYMRNALDRLEHCTKPTIAMIRGYCLGGGLLVALHTDMRIAADTARLGIPAAKLGIAYTLSGVQKVLDLVGPASRARCSSPRVNSTASRRRRWVSSIARRPKPSSKASRALIVPSWPRTRRSPSPHPKASSPS